MPEERRTQHVTLGCGTLLLIALIVLIFSRPGNTNLEQEVRALRSEVAELKKAVDAQTNEIRRLPERLNQFQPGGAEGQ
jgi:type II secretory pathway component PulM